MIVLPTSHTLCYCDTCIVRHNDTAAVKPNLIIKRIIININV